jgi:hypothetical protein
MRRLMIVFLISLIIGFGMSALMAEVHESDLDRIIRESNHWVEIHGYSDEEAD